MNGQCGPKYDVNMRSPDCRREGCIQDRLKQRRHRRTSVTKTHRSLAVAAVTGCRLLAVALGCAVRGLRRCRCRRLAVAGGGLRGRAVLGCRLLCRLLRCAAVGLQANQCIEGADRIISIASPNKNDKT